MEEENPDFSQSETEESTENTQDSPQKEANKPVNQKVSAVPVYLAVVLVVLGLVLGFVAGYYFVQCPVADECEPEPEPIPPLEATLLYAEECTVCQPLNIFQLFLEQNDIEFNLTKVEITSAEGAALVEKYNITSVPTLLISEDSVSPKIIATSTAGVDAPLRAFLEEKLLDDMYVLQDTGMFLDKEEFCNAEETKTQIMLFEDPYSPVSISNFPILKALTDDFVKDGNAVVFEYEYLPTQHSNILYENFGKDRTELLAKYYLCAQEQGKLIEFADAAMDKYCDKNNDGNANDVEMGACSIANPLFDVPFDQEKLDEFAEAVGLNSADLNSCLVNIDLEFSKHMADAIEFNIPEISYTVVDCKYSQSIRFLGDVLCNLHSELDACTANE